MMLKVLLCVAVFAVTANSWSLKKDDDEGLFPSSTGGRNLDQDINERGIEQTRQEQEGQWRRVGEGSREEKWRVHGKQGDNEMSGGQGGTRTENSYSGLRVEELQRGKTEQRRQGDQENDQLRGRQVDFSSSEGSSSSQDESYVSHGIMKAQKQYHDTDPVYARNGRKVSNHESLRSHKAPEHELKYSEEVFNTIHKDKF